MIKNPPPHVTVGYVRPGALKELDGHQYFDGELWPIASLIYSDKGRAEKTIINL